jgi:hypothetical protein
MIPPMALAATPPANAIASITFPLLDVRPTMDTSSRGWR